MITDQGIENRHDEKLSTSDDMDIDTEDDDEDASIFRYQHYENKDNIFLDINMNYPCGCNANPHTTMNWSANTCSCCHKTKYDTSSHSFDISIPTKYLPLPQSPSFISSFIPPFTDTNVVVAQSSPGSFSTSEPPNCVVSSGSPSCSISSVPPNCVVSSGSPSCSISSVPLEDVAPPADSGSSASITSKPVIFKKYIPKSFFPKGKFSNLNLDKSFLKNCGRGLYHFWPSNINDVDRFCKFEGKLIDKDKANLNKNLNLKSRELLESTNKTKAVIVTELVSKDNYETNENKAFDKAPSKIKLYDKFATNRCPSITNGKACSSKCSKIHVLPKDDGIVCRYYYFHFDCNEDTCIYLHTQRCSELTEESFHDRWASDRCSMIMNGSQCPSKILCTKMHRIPKEDNIYCIHQLHFVCYKGIKCNYLHRDELNVPDGDKSSILPIISDVNVEQEINILSKGNRTNESINLPLSKVVQKNQITIDLVEEPEWEYSGNFYGIDSDDERRPLYSGLGHIVAILKTNKTNKANENNSNSGTVKRIEKDSEIDNKRLQNKALNSKRSQDKSNDTTLLNFKRKSQDDDCDHISVLNIKRELSEKSTDNRTVNCGKVLQRSNLNIEVIYISDNDEEHHFDSNGSVSKPSYKRTEKLFEKKKESNKGISGVNKLNTIKQEYKEYADENFQISQNTATVSFLNEAVGEADDINIIKTDIGNMNVYIKQEPIENMESVSSITANSNNANNCSSPDINSIPKSLPVCLLNHTIKEEEESINYTTSILVKEKITITENYANINNEFQFCNIKEEIISSDKINVEGLNNESRIIRDEEIENFSCDSSDTVIFEKNNAKTKVSKNLNKSTSFSEVLSNLNETSKICEDVFGLESNPIHHYHENFSTNIDQISISKTTQSLSSRALVMPEKNLIEKISIDNLPTNSLQNISELMGSPIKIINCEITPKDDISKTKVSRNSVDSVSKSLSEQMTIEKSDHNSKKYLVDNSPMDELQNVSKPMHFHIKNSNCKPTSHKGDSIKVTSKSVDSVFKSSSEEITKEKSAHSSKKYSVDNPSINALQNISKMHSSIKASSYKPTSSNDDDPKSKEFTNKSIDSVSKSLSKQISEKSCHSSKIYSKQNLSDKNLVEKKSKTRKTKVKNHEKCSIRSDQLKNFLAGVSKEKSGTIGDKRPPWYKLAKKMKKCSVRLEDICENKNAKNLSFTCRYGSFDKTISLKSKVNKDKLSEVKDYSITNSSNSTNNESIKTTLKTNDKFKIQIKKTENSLSKSEPLQSHNSLDKERETSIEKSTSLQLSSEKNKVKSVKSSSKEKSSKTSYKEKSNDKHSNSKVDDSIKKSDSKTKEKSHLSSSQHKDKYKLSKKEYSERKSYQEKSNDKHSNSKVDDSTKKSDSKTKEKSHLSSSQHKDKYKLSKKEYSERKSYQEKSNDKHSNSKVDDSTKKSDSKTKEKSHLSSSQHKDKYKLSKKEYSERKSHKLSTSVENIKSDSHGIFENSASKVKDFDIIENTRKHKHNSNSVQASNNSYGKDVQSKSGTISSSHSKNKVKNGHSKNYFTDSVSETKPQDSPKRKLNKSPLNQFPNKKQKLFSNSEINRKSIRLENDSCSSTSAPDSVDKNIHTENILSKRKSSSSSISSVENLSKKQKIMCEPKLKSNCIEIRECSTKVKSRSEKDLSDLLIKPNKICSTGNKEHMEDKVQSMKYRPGPKSKRSSNSCDNSFFENKDLSRLKSPKHNSENIPKLVLYHQSDGSYGKRPVLEIKSSSNSNISEMYYESTENMRLVKKGSSKSQSDSDSTNASPNRKIHGKSLSMRSSIKNSALPLDYEYSNLFMNKSNSAEGQKLILNSKKSKEIDEKYEVYGSSSSSQKLDSFENKSSTMKPNCDEDISQVQTLSEESIDSTSNKIRNFNCMSSISRQHDKGLPSESFEEKNSHRNVSSDSDVVLNNEQKEIETGDFSSSISKSSLENNQRSLLGETNFSDTNSLKLPSEIEILKKRALDERKNLSKSYFNSSEKSHSKLKDVTNPVVSKASDGSISNYVNQGIISKRDETKIRSSDKLTLVKIYKSPKHDLSPSKKDHIKCVSKQEDNKDLVNEAAIKSQKSNQKLVRDSDTQCENIINPEEEYIFDAAQQTLESIRNKAYERTDLCDAFIDLCKEYNLKYIELDNSIQSLDANIRLFLIFLFKRKHNIQIDLNEFVSASFKMNLITFKITLENMEKEYTN